jgi:hypothetical protein
LSHRGPLTYRSRISPPTRFDLFLAHPSADKPSARTLYDLLQPGVRVFLDERSILPGVRWDQEIPAAQRASRATVILVSSHADAAWYLSDEVVTAIALHRAAPDAHLIIPVRLDPDAPLPYGLSHVQALDAGAVGGLAGVAARLREILREEPWAPQDVKPGGGPAASQTEAPRQTAPPPPAQAPSVGRCDHRRLHARMTKLTDPIFEEILFYAEIERRHVAPPNAPLSARILDVAQLAAHDADLCRRIAALLDERAPWTR